jgi:hypothetical protein
MGLKKWYPDVRFSGNKVTPDEIDAYSVYQIVNPGISTTWFASAGTAGTSAVVAMVITNRLPDYPRNITMSITGSHNAMGGTLTVNGKNQFGEVIQEAIGFSGSNNGGSAIGTKVFAQITSGSLAYGTATGSGTPAIGFELGTACLFGLPSRLLGTTDVVHLGMTAGTGAITYGGGTIAAFVNVGQSAIRPAAALTGTEAITVWYKNNYSNESTATLANLSQAV